MEPTIKDGDTEKLSNGFRIQYGTSGIHMCKFGILLRRETYIGKIYASPENDGYEVVKEVAADIASKFDNVPDADYE